MIKNIIVACVCGLIANQVAAQNVGIGTHEPLMKLHVSSNDSALALFENKQPLALNVSTALYFKTGIIGWPYTGAIKTIGETSGTARLGLFTYASASPNLLLERLSIADNGKIGAGTIKPQTDFHINPDGQGSLLIGTNRSSGGYTNIEMGISSQSNGYGFLQATKTSGSNYGVLALNAGGGNVGIGTTTPSTTLDVNGGISMPVKVVTNDYAATTNDYTIVANMQNNVNINLKIYLPASTEGRIINVVGINLPNRYLSSQYGPTNRPNGRVYIVNADGSQLQTYSVLGYSSGQQEYPLSPLPGIESTTIKVYLSSSNITFQYVNSQIGWVQISQSTDSYEDYNTHIPPTL